MNNKLTKRLITAYRGSPLLSSRIPIHRISDYLNQHLSLDNCHEIGIGTSSPSEVACAAFNLMEGLLDSRHKLPAMSNDKFTLVKDIGVTELSVGNASGGVFAGPYRSFIIDVNGAEQTVSFGISTYNTSNRPDLVRTVLLVAVKNNNVCHHALQLVLDDNVIIEGNKVHFFHSGRIGISNKGSGKISELREIVRQEKPDLLFDKRFYLGALTHDRLWNLNDPELMALIENLIHYALIREEYRRIKLGR